jgi:hypothetical protein
MPIWPPRSQQAEVIMSDLIKRIEGAIDRITTGSAPMRVPPDDTDPDMVLVDCKRAIDAAQRRIAYLEDLNRRMLAAADALDAKRKAAVADAARFRWLRTYNKLDWTDEQIDRQIAIDAALSKQQAQEG